MSLLRRMLCQIYAARLSLLENLLCHASQVRDVLVESWALRLVLSEHTAQRPLDLSSLFAANALDARRLDPARGSAAAAVAADSRSSGADIGKFDGWHGPPNTAAAEAIVERSETGREERRAGKGERRKRKAELRAERRERKRRRRRRRSSDSDDSDLLPYGASEGSEGKEARWEVMVGCRRLQFAESEAAEELSAAAAQVWLQWVWRTTERT